MFGVRFEWVLRIYISDPMSLELRLSGSSRSRCTVFWSQSSELFLSVSFAVI